MNLTLNQFRIFQKVAETRSISKAAEELNLTQPAVSIQLRNFQQQFSVPLIEVVRKRIYLTDFGKEIADSAAEILAQVDDIHYRMHARMGALVGKLRLSVVSSGKYVAPYFVSGFIGRHEGVDFQMDVQNKLQVVRDLEQNQCDFALVTMLPEHLSIEKIDLMDNFLVMAGGPASGISLPESASLIFREPGSATRLLMEKFVKSRKIPFRKKMELTSSEAVKQAVMAGLGFSLVPLAGIKNELENNELKIIPMDGLPIKTAWSLIWLKEKTMSPLSLAFVEYMKKEMGGVRDERFSWMEEYQPADQKKTTPK